MRRRLVLGIVMTAAVVVLAASAAMGATGDDTVSLATVDPAAGPSGTEVAFTLAGTDDAGVSECLTSSAYRLEFLAPDGVLAATGGDTVAVPADAQAGDASIRLVCYVPDATGRRVIHGLCGRFVVTEPGAVVPPAGAAAIACAATPRLALSQSVIAVERAISEAFNPILAAPLTG